MSEPKDFCPNCKELMDFVVTENGFLCPVCRHEFKPDDVLHHPETKNENTGCLRSFLIMLSVIIGIILLFLAFVYAECSHFINN